jgi:hypothetical protein
MADGTIAARSPAAPEAAVELVAELLAELLAEAAAELLGAGAAVFFLLEQPLTSSVAAIAKTPATRAERRR